MILQLSAAMKFPRNLQLCLSAAIWHSGSLRLRWRFTKETNCDGLGESALPLGCKSGGELEMTRTIGDDGFFCIIKQN
jgi:hypothetical protein